MKDKKLELINENNSPLFRIMSVYNSSAPNKAFANNICAFHIGKGIIVSVAHNLRALDRLPILLSILVSKRTEYKIRRCKTLNLYSNGKEETQISQLQDKCRNGAVTRRIN